MARTKPDRPEHAKPVRASIAAIDQEILRLLVKRSNLLEKIRDRGNITAQDEKFLRESWQNDVARVSRDPELSGRFFSLMQQISFLPPPSERRDAKTASAGRGETFILAPKQLPVAASLVCPLSEWQTAAWLYLACAAGQAMRLYPTLQSDTLVDFVRCLTQMEGSASREDDAIVTRQGMPLGAPDKVIHLGSGKFCLYLIIAHYAGRHAHVKLSADSSLNLLDLSSLRRFLPQLGCRLINIVPKSATLPARIEASGIIPAGVEPEADVPQGFVEALILAAPFYNSPFAINLAGRPDRAEILARTLPLLRESGAIFKLDGATLALEPGLLTIPPRPKVALEPELATFLCGFAFALGGSISLMGYWPDWPMAADIWQLCQQNGFRRGNGEISAEFAEPSRHFSGAPDDGPCWQRAFACALAACACMRGGNIELPVSFCEDPDVADFMRIAGLGLAPDGSLHRAELYKGLAWNAPTPAWSMALAIAACARKTGGFPLGNPGIVYEFWPHFWQFYNSLPEPRLHKRKKEHEPNPPTRRRIITSAVAVPPELHEDDWN